MLHSEGIASVVLDGRSLTLEGVVAVARHGARVEIAREATARMAKARALVEEILEKGAPVYGINTGFGAFSQVSISQDQVDQLQANLVMSHAVGCGEPLDEDNVRSMLLLRANALCQGHSGIRSEVVELLADMLNAGVHPVIPEQGSLGASGDLAPLAHMALVLMGKGEAFYLGKRLPGDKALTVAGLKPVQLKAKEGLALINGTQMMGAVGALALADTIRAARLADITASLTLEALQGLSAAFDPRIHTLRPHPGQALVAKNIRALTEGSELADGARPCRVQDAYSLRCIPQVHGAVRDALVHVRQVLETEFNAVTDNPLLFPEEGEVLSGGNFHGEPLALALDYLGIAAAELAGISERRLERMVNPQLSCGLPAFLVKDGGVNSGMMILQYTAAALVSENKVLAHPASVDSIPSSANQEDHVSMGAHAARKARKIAENTLSVLSLELLSAAQATEARGGKPSPFHQELISLVRERVPFLSEDRELRLDIEAMGSLIKKKAILDLAARMAPEFR
ncbi:MAG: histidine ammonia-lyase [Eubacteriales bacterium]|nr:histidine ammonia-lyase [Eubacteriales bacterium]